MQHRTIGRRDIGSDREGAATRRAVLCGGAGIGLVAASAEAAPAAAASAAANPPPVPQPRVPGQDRSEPRPPFVAGTERRAPPELPPLPPEKRVGFALVGLGRLSLEELLPAFGETRFCRLAAVVTGDAAKGRRVAAQHGLPEGAVLGYDAIERLREIPAVQVVYVVTPNGMHRDQVLRAAAAGKHVLCEKPMANDAAEAEAMVQGCARTGVKLMVAYRNQYEPHCREVTRMVRSGEFGALKMIEAHHVQVQGEADQWRHSRALAGGGALPDIGLYCLNFSRFTTGEEPVELAGWAWSTPGDPRFREVEENVSWQMRFPSGCVGRLATGYDAHKAGSATLFFQHATVQLQNAFAYTGQRLTVIRRAPDRADVELREERVLGAKNQFAAEMDHMAEAVLNDRQPHTPGEEGLQDHRIMDAIYRAARENRPVTLPRIDGPDAFRGPAPGQG